MPHSHAIRWRHSDGGDALDVRHFIRGGGNHPRDSASARDRKSRARYSHIGCQHRARDRRDAPLPADRTSGHRYLLARDDHRSRDRLPWPHYDRDAGGLSLACVK